jgi:DNA-directed RNA polymerase
MTVTLNLSAKYQQEQAEYAQIASAQNKAQGLLDAMAKAGKLGDTKVGSATIGEDIVVIAAKLIENGRQQYVMGRKNWHPTIAGYMSHALVVKPDPEKPDKDNSKEVQASANMLAYLTMQTLFNAATATGGEEMFALDTEIAGAKVTLKVMLPTAAKQAKVVCDLGKAVELEAKLAALAVADKQLATKLKYSYLKDPVFGMAYATKKVNEAIEAAETFNWEAWPTEQHAKLGFWLVGQMLSAYPEGEAPFEVTEVYTMRCGNKKSQNFVQLGDKLAAKKTALDVAVKGFAMNKLPMLVQPEDWDGTNYGGYLTNETTKLDKLVRRHDGVVPAIGQQPLTMLNNLQKVGYMVNSGVLDVALTLAAAEVAVDKFVPFKDGMSKPAARKAKRTEAAVEAAQQFVGKVFYVPWSFDYRGRVYPIASVLHPQGTDFDKALLVFANERPIEGTDAHKWLAVHLANCWGNMHPTLGKKTDKLTLNQRVEWTESSLSTIAEIAADPLNTVDKWAKASEPWQFMAACVEYAALFINKTKATTNLMVATDCTNSGLQILAGLTKDRETAEKVNVVPTAEPQDAYMAVAKVAQQLLAEQGLDHLCTYLADRNVAKKVVMTVPYNAKLDTNSSNVYQAIKKFVKANPDVPMVTSAEASKIAAAIEAALKQLMKGAIGFRDNLNKAIKAFVKAQGADSQNYMFSWATPSGFVVVQNQGAKEVVELKTNLTVSNKKRAKVKVAIGYLDQTDVNKHGSCTAPNLIHSLDASLLHTAFAQFDAPFTLIHDSVLTTAADMKWAVGSMQEAYAYCFSDEVGFVDYFAGLLGTNTLVPAVANTFTPDEVTGAEYFLS